MTLNTVVNASFRNTTEVEIWVNATDFQGGQIKLTYDVTEVVINPDPPYTVTLTADPMAIPADGVSSSTLRAMVTDQYGNPVADWTAVTFTLIVRA